MKKFRKYSVLVFTGTMLLLTAACKKSENFYQSLVDLPEIRKIYDNAYEVGSQMIITGRLNPDNGLKIEIGGITAKITGLTKVVGGGTQYAPYYVDQATLTITKEMGIGPNRPVKITSAGNTIDGPPIEIFHLVIWPIPCNWLVTALCRQVAYHYMESMVKGVFTSTTGQLTASKK